MNPLNRTHNVEVPDKTLVVALLATVDGKLVEYSFNVPFGKVNNVAESGSLQRLTSACLDTMVERIKGAQQ